MNSGTTLLHEAAKSKPTSNFFNRYVTYTLLLQCGADTTSTDEKGNSPLHILANELQKFLNEPFATSPLSQLQAHSKEDIILSAQLLLQHGAHADARNANGEIALDVFRKFDLPGFDVFSFVKLQCLAARVVRSINYQLKEIPDHLIDFVNQH
jgi:hypothetical protein